MKEIVVGVSDLQAARAALAEAVGPAPTIGAEHMAGSQRAGHSTSFGPNGIRFKLW
jgi:hypothetical protein